MMCDITEPTEDAPKIAEIIAEMRAYADSKQTRDTLIKKGLDAKIPVWRIAQEMHIDPKTVTKVKREHNNQGKTGNTK